MSNNNFLQQYIRAKSEIELAATAALCKYTPFIFALFIIYINH